MKKKMTAVFIIGFLICSLTGCGRDSITNILQAGSLKEEQRQEETTEEATEETTEETTEAINSADETSETPEAATEMPSEKSESENKDEKDVKKKEKDSMMEKIAKAYIDAINNSEDKFRDYRLLYISSSGYPQLIMLESIMDGLIECYDTYNLYTTDEEGCLVCLEEDAHGNGGNYAWDRGYYEKQGVIEEDCRYFDFTNNGDYVIYYDGQYLLENNELKQVYKHERKLMYDGSGEVGETEEGTKIETVGERKSYFDNSDSMSRKDMIAYLKTFIDDTSSDESGTEWKAIYKKCLKDIFDRKETLYNKDYIFYYGDYPTKIYYLIQDITGDGIPELLINPTFSDDDYYWSVYYIKDGTYQYFHVGDSSFVVFTDPDKKKVYVRSSYYGSYIDIYNEDISEYDIDRTICDEQELRTEKVDLKKRYSCHEDGEIKYLSENEWKAFWTDYKRGLDKYRFKKGTEISPESIDTFLED